VDIMLPSNISLEEPSKEEALRNRIAELEETIALMSEKITVMSLDKFGLERFFQ